MLVLAVITILATMATGSGNAAFLTIPMLQAPKIAQASTLMLIWSKRGRLNHP